MLSTKEILEKAKVASSDTSSLTTEIKNNALESMAKHLLLNADEILKANSIDLEAAKGHISPTMLDRLALNFERISAMADGIRQVAALPDPVGIVLDKQCRDDGLLIEKVSVPIGVVAIIYESRPNVTSDAAALSVKSGNVCVLRGGKEAYCSASAIVKALRSGLVCAGVNPDIINLIEDTTRQSATELMKAQGYIDMLIPRGGAGLIQACIENATVPCIQTGTGICHIYVDKSANQEMALKIIENAKMSRPSVCNAAEVCLVHKDIAAEFLPKLKRLLCDPEREHTAVLRPDNTAAEILGMEANPEFDTEFLDYILAIGVVDDTEDAISHIAKHSTHHSEAIITTDSSAAQRFTLAVDSAAVYVNASTRFTDGGEFGLGCEMGISTQKLHARGPMGLREMTTYKYIITGNGQTRG